MGEASGGTALAALMGKFGCGDADALLERVRADLNAIPVYGLNEGQVLARRLSSPAALAIAVDYSQWYPRLWNALRACAANLGASDDSMPDGLADWTRSVAGGRVNEPARTVQRCRPNTGRDMAIAYMVENLHRISGDLPGPTLNITRSHAKGSQADGCRSCCDVVGAALPSPLAYKTVENIWTASPCRKFGTRFAFAVPLI